MKISYSWLKEYIDIDLSDSELDEILTQIGLEVGGIEKFESVKGGLEGLVIGEVKTCEPHPNSDHLSMTTVDVGGEELLPIVCGAPNVAQGQKVVVATVGTVLYDGDDSFKIKKSKIRGEQSMGMICAEDEIGLGASHDGIMVLPSDAPVGIAAKEYFDIETDKVIEIDLTPNRVDGSSHIGVARDLAAYFKQKQEIEYTKPSVEEFKAENSNLSIDIKIDKPEACKRYSGLCIEGVEVKESPEWIQNRLKAIGLNPINNIVDITNYVLFETGQPLHAFDYDKIESKQVVVKTLEKDTKFVSLDNEERSLHENDLMICDKNTPMCIAGVFGGSESGVSNNTKNIFLESAYFDSVFVRKTARRFGLNTDASFRFERGTDPNNTVYALKRAALLIKEIAGGTISSEITDIYPEAIKDFEIEVSVDRIERLLGKKIGKETIVKILTALEIKVAEDNGDVLLLNVPPYRVDVQREADIAEDILRIYGFNNIEVSEKLSSCISSQHKPDEFQLKNMVADMLTSNGFNEIMNNSLTRARYCEGLETYKSDNNVMINNPLSSDLNAMRQTLLFGGLESISYNINRKNPNLKFYEFGKSYQYFKKEENQNPVDNYHETELFSIFISGNINNQTWNSPETPSNFFYLKSYVEMVLSRLGVMTKIKIKEFDSDVFIEGLEYSTRKNTMVKMGLVEPSILKGFDIDTPVYYAEFYWEAIMKEHKNSKIEYKDISKYPAVKRDLSLLVDKSVKFSQIKEIANNSERKLLKSVDIFDVYEGENLGENKKSYAVSFIIQDEEKTLKDKQIDKIMQKIISSLEKQLSAQIR